MRVTGALMVALGCFVMMLNSFRDISVSTEAGSVANFSLMQGQLIGFLFGLGVFGGGIVLCAAGAICAELRRARPQMIAPTDPVIQQEPKRRRLFA